MSFILCRQEEVTHPLYIEALGVHIWSSQELCYVIYNYPLLAMDHFLDERLTEFIEKELRMTVLAARLENGLRTGADEDELIFMFLEECHFYSPKEITAFRQKISSYRNMGSLEFAKLRQTTITRCASTAQRFGDMKSCWTASTTRRRMTNFWERSGTIWLPAMQACSGLTRPCSL